MLRVEGLKKVFRSGRSDLVLFDNLSFRVTKGEMLAIVGESGAGKSTLLHILGALDTPSGGDVYCAQIKLRIAFRRGRSRISQPGDRLRVAVPLPAAGVHGAGERGHAAAGAGRRPVARRKRKRRGGCAKWGWRNAPTTGPESFRGGEQQRVALARALVTRPQLLLADEPTGDLDNRTAEAVFELIARLHRDYRLTSLIATHNLAFARRCRRVLRLAGGPAGGSCGRNCCQRSAMRHTMASRRARGPAAGSQIMKNA